MQLDCLVVYLAAAIRIEMPYSKEKYLQTKDQRREWRLANKDKVNTWVRNWRLKRKEKIVACMGGKCTDCGGVFPSIVYDMHHLDPSQKEMGLGQLKNYSWKRIVAELAKCVMLCVNCHRVRHSYQENDVQE